MNHTEQKPERFDRETTLILIALFSALLLCAGVTIYQCWELF